MKVLLLGAGGLKPNSPYAASNASSDHLVRACHGLFNYSH